MQTPDVVVLVPGFLGFARFGGFYYFADRVASVMRGHLEEALGYPVPVVPCTTLPTDSLSQRKDLVRRFNLRGGSFVILVGDSHRDQNPSQPLDDRRAALRGSHGLRRAPSLRAGQRGARLRP